MTVAIHRPPIQVLSSEQIVEIKAELSAALNSESFASSPRCRDFLECVVELTLAGDRDSLTERFLGVKLFGRAVDYETATDSIVRVRANDVRRRLMQFYSIPRPESKVHIEMAAGRYVPEFRWLRDTDHPAAAFHEPQVSRTAASPVLPQATAVGPAPTVHYWRRSIKVLLWGLAVLAISAATYLAVQSRSSDNLDAFWKPVLDAPGQPVLNLPTTDTFQLTLDPERTNAPLTNLQPGQSLKLGIGDFVGFHDWHVSVPVLQATLSVALVFDRKGKTPLVRVGTDLKSDELQGHPVIAIGSFSNAWTKATVNGLRFTFDRGASDREPPRIRDSQNPQRSWELPHTYPEPQDKDYAIITRTFDPVTGEPFVSLAGLHSFGNQIAGEFVSQEHSWDEVARRAPHGWQKMNLQILIEADVVGTTPGSPKIVDVYFWK